MRNIICPMTNLGVGGVNQTSILKINKIIRYLINFFYIFITYSLGIEFIYE